MTAPSATISASIVARSSDESVTQARRDSTWSDGVGRTTQIERLKGKIHSLEGAARAEGVGL